MGVNVVQLDGWIPIRLYWELQQPVVDWCWIGARRFTEPFFHQTINQCLQLPFSSLFRPQTSIEMLRDKQAIDAGLEPAGLIFHMSRSGSTLVSQMLSAISGSAVISEAGPIDSVLRARFQDVTLPDSVRAEWLRWLVSALSSSKSNEERRLFIKFDSWAVFDLPIVQAAFPGAPWVFVYREPLDVLESQLNHRGAHMVPGAIEPELFGFTSDEVFEMQPEDYCARVLARICESALRHHQESGGLLVNYNQLPDAITRVTEHFGIELSPSDTEVLRKAAKLDGKNPAIQFTPDSRPGRKPPTDAMKRAAERWIGPVYAQLEAGRLANRKDS